MKNLRIVHLEDDPLDRELVEQALRVDGLPCTFVEAHTRGAFEAALQEQPDLILSDMSLPDFDGITAQQIALRRWPMVPFLYVSGSMGEEAAIERLRAGATDYVLKHRLEKLPSAVRRAVREAEDRRQRSTAEDALRHLNAELEHRVSERTEALTKANEDLVRARLEAERANLAKSDFLSRMSHDLRTPLNAIMGFAQVLEMEGLVEEQREGVTHILKAGGHLLEMINEVLDISRIEAGRMSLSLEPVHLEGLVAGAVELIQPLASRRGLDISIAVPADIHVLADRVRLNQVVLNLLSNAVKYNRDGGSVRVAAARAGTEATVSVTDTGSGISPDQLSRLFTPFERLGAERSGIEGTGLGLAVVKGLLDVMGGSVEVSTVVDQGSTFTITLPATEDVGGQGLDMETNRYQPDTGASGIVLYLEDNVSNVRLMQAVLSKRPGITMLHASDGETGLAMMRQQQPDLVMLDLHLPRLTGQEVLRRMAADPKIRRVPVVALTADATATQLRSTLALGATAYLTKPVDVAQVLAVLDRLLAPAHAEDA